MTDIDDITPPDAPTPTSTVENQLTDSARKILYIHYSHYNRIDQKAQRFLTMIGAVEGYFIINFVLNRKFDSSDKSWLIMLLALLIGAIVIVLYISILQSRPFYNGPNIEAQANDFRPDGNPDDLRKDTLATLKISYQENVKIINQKSQLFKMSIRGICLYFIVLACYFAVLKANENEIPNDILLWTDTIMPTNEQNVPEELLITDNVGAVEADNKQIEKAEQENTQEEQSEIEQGVVTPWTVTPWTDDELKSDNLDVTGSEKTNL